MNTWIEMLNLASAAWAGAMLRACWQGGLAILLAWALCRALPKLPPAVQCWLWRLAYLKLLVAFCWATPIDVPLLPAPPTPPVEVAGGSSNPAPPPVPAPALSVTRPVAAEAGTPAPPLPPPLSAAGWLLVFWVLGAVGYGVLVLRAGLQTARFRRACEPLAQAGLTVCCAELSRALRLRRAPGLLVSWKVPSPLLLGLIRPAVVLPGVVAAESPPAELRLVLAHELAHLKRHDLWWAWLPVLAQGLFFFHPLVWLARREGRLAQEMACDELAVRVTNCSVAVYGGLLVNLSIPHRRGLRAGLHTIGVVESFQTLKRRLIAMRNYGPLSRRRTLLAGAVVTLLGLTAVVPWRVTAQNPAQPPAPVVAAQNPKEVAVESDTVLVVAYAPDGKSVAGGGFDKSVKLWDPQTGKLLRTVVGHTGGIRALAYAPGGKFLASGGDDKLVRLWDTQTGQQVRTFPQEMGSVDALAYSPDGTVLATGSFRITNAGHSSVGEVRLWDTRTGKLQRTLKPEQEHAWSIAFSPDGKSLATAEGPVVQLRDAVTGEVKRTLQPERGKVLRLAFSADGRTLAGGGGHWIPQGGGTVMISAVSLWNYRTGELQRTLTDLHPWLRSVAFSPDGKILATGSSGPIRQRGKATTVTSELKLWDARTGEWRRTIEGSLSEVNSIAFSPDGKSIVSCDGEEVSLTDAGTGERKHTLMIRTLGRIIER